jgi:cytochrome P450
MCGWGVPGVSHDQLIDDLTRRADEIDLVGEFAAELSVLVILDILGVPERDFTQVKTWSDGQIALLWGNPGPGEQIRLAHGLVEFWAYCRRLVRTRRAGAGADFVSQVLAYRDGDDTVLTEAEVASLAFNLLVAGHETTAGLLAHCLDLALCVPTRWSALVDEPTTVAAFVEETLRHSPAIDGWLRVTRVPTTIGAATIPAGSRCLLLIGAANHDHRVFAEPGAFCPQRPNNHDHLSFGAGQHYCVGAALARLEAGYALGRLVECLPDLRLAPHFRRAYLPNVGFRAHVWLSALARAG